jgi:hypothetical protein
MRILPLLQSKGWVSAAHMAKALQFAAISWADAVATGKRAALLTAKK